MGGERAKAHETKKASPAPPPPVVENPPLMLVLPPTLGPVGGNAMAVGTRTATPIGFVPAESTLDPVAEGNEIANAIRHDDYEKILEILRRNSHPRDMYALIRNYSGDMVRLLARMSMWSESQWRRAQAYLGNQVPLDLQIEKHAGDREAVFADLARIPDEQALPLLIEESPITWIELQPREGDPIPPARARRVDVIAALRKALDGTAYYDAIRLLLGKADRALKASRTTAPQPLAGQLQIALPGAPYSIFELPALGDPSQVDSVLVDAVQLARIELALEIMRDADAKDWGRDKTARSRMYLALADLDAVERRVAVPRLRETITKHTEETSTIELAASNLDDVSMIRSLVINAAVRDAQLNQDLDASTLQVALERGGKLLRDARRNAEPEGTVTGEPAQTKARAEVTRIEGALLDWDMLTVLRREPAQLEARLKALGATPLQVGTELLRQTSSGDFDAIIATVKRIDVDVRVDAIVQSGMLDQLDWLDANQRELLAAHLTVGREAKVHPTTTKLFGRPSTDYLLYAHQNPPSELPYVKRDDAPLIFDAAALAPDFRLLQHDLYASRPRTVIAIAQILDDLAHDRAAAALGLIRRLDEHDRIEVYADERVRAAISRFGASSRAGDVWVREALNEAWFSPQVELGVLAKRSGDTQAILEAISGRSDELGNAELRRGFVLAHRLAANPGLELTEEERNQIRTYQAALSWGEKLSGWKDNETFKHLLLGQPKITGGLDPTAEAEFMMFRLADRAGARNPKAVGQALQDVFGSAGPSVDEALARFETYYLQVREGGVTPAELAQLGELYHDAMRAMDRFLDDNESFAHRAARIVGGVVAAVIVIAFTAGGATPFVIGAAAGLGAGVAEAATGAAIRTESNLDQVAIDFGAGAIEGVMMAVGNALGARAVQALGLAGGQLAVRAGGEAMRKVSHGFFASIVENAIAGAIGGASSEIFETAVDRATWDRGIAEAFTKILAAAARGAALGAGMASVISVAFHGLGAIVSRLAQKHGPTAARGVAEMLEATGGDAATLQRLSQIADDDLVRAWELLQAQRYAEAEALLDSLKLPAHARSAILEFARVRYAMRALGELGALPEGAVIKPEILAADDFYKAVGHQRGDAAVVIRKGKPQILVKRGAAPSVIREEMVHVVQFYTDPLMRARMLMLSEENLAAWATKSAAERAEMYVAKLEVEADAQRRILAMLEDDIAAGDREAVLRALDAQETLGNLNTKLGAARLARAEGALEALAPDAAPLLFAKGAQTPRPPRISKRAAADVKRLVTKGRGLNVNKPKDLEILVDEFGYIPGKTADGKIFRVSRATKATDTMPHLQVEADGRVVIGERPSFREQQIDAAEQWRALSDIKVRMRSPIAEVREIAKKEHEALAKTFHAELAKKVANQELDEASAGLLLKWGRVIEKVDQEVGDAAARRVLVELVERIPKGTAGSLSQAEIDEFRRIVRDRVVSYLQTIRNGTQRMKAMHSMFELMDPSSQGRLFTEYRRTVLHATLDQPGGASLFSPHEAPTPFKLRGGITRTPDDAATLLEDIPGLRKGRYALEDKAGEHAFKLDQARDYARGVANSTEYDGLVYVFSNRTDASAARNLLRLDPKTKGLLGKADRGIHITYFDEQGRWRLLE